MECRYQRGIHQRVCDTCSSAESKYRCPRCARRSCSLACVQKHKQTYECNGKRDCTGFTSVPDFTDTQLLSDYYFLEDVSRFIGSARRDRVTNCNNHQSWRKNRQMNYLSGAASKRGIKLFLVSSSLSLHRSNTSRVLYDRVTRKQTILWRVHLVFPQSQADYHCQEVCENDLVSDLLEKFIHPKNSNPVARHRLCHYVACGGVDAVSVFMKVERTRLRSDRFYQLNKNRSLGDNLRGKTIVEFPTLYVVTADGVDNYPLYSDSDKQPEQTTSLDCSNKSQTATAVAQLPSLSSSITAATNTSQSYSITAATSTATGTGSGADETTSTNTASVYNISLTNNASSTTATAIVCDDPQGLSADSDDTGVSLEDCQPPYQLVVEGNVVDERADRDSSVWSSEEEEEEREGVAHSLGNSSALRLIASVYNN